MVDYQGSFILVAPAIAMSVVDVVPGQFSSLTFGVSSDRAGTKPEVSEVTATHNAPPPSSLPRHVDCAFKKKKVNAYISLHVADIHQQVSLQRHGGFHLPAVCPAAQLPAERLGPEPPSAGQVSVLRHPDALQGEPCSMDRSKTKKGEHAIPRECVFETSVFYLH